MVITSEIVRAVGLTEPVAIVWSDTKPEDALVIKPGIWACVMLFYAKVVLEGKTAAFSRDKCGCPVMTVPPTSVKSKFTLRMCTIRFKMVMNFVMKNSVSEYRINPFLDRALEELQQLLLTASIPLQWRSFLESLHRLSLLV